MDSWFTFQVGSVKFVNGLPNFPLKFDIMLELIDDSVESFCFYSVVILIQFGGHISLGLWVLMRQVRVFSIFYIGVLFKFLQVGFCGIDALWIRVQRKRHFRMESEGLNS